jgi:hypothetical protein
LLFVLGLGASSGSSAAVGTVYTVDTIDGTTDNACGNGSDCSFGDAIVAANGNLGKDTIAFDIPGAGPHLIVLPALAAGPFPTVTDAVVIDGTTEPDYADAPVVEIDASGRGEFGLRIQGAASAGTEVRGMTIYGANSGVDHAMDFANPGANVVERNFIGTDTSATVAKGRGGVTFGPTIAGVGSSDGNVVADNVIVGSGGSAVQFERVSNSQVLRNHIGTNAAGTVGLSGHLGVGILIGSGSSRNLLSDNVIAARSQGITILGASDDNRVEGNKIGTDTVQLDLRNNSWGIGIVGGGGVASRTVIGGADRDARNVISGNDGDGIVLTSAIDTTAQGNLIGTDRTGTLDRGNGGVGVDVIQTTGATLIKDNVISGNDGAGISGGALATGSMQVEGNLIGTNEAGTAAVPNSRDGIVATLDGDTVIGGESESQRNVISGNLGNGLSTSARVAHRTTVLHNYIGTNKAGDAPLRNDGYGIEASGSGETTIGKPEAGNVISANGRAGIHVLVDGVVIQANLIGADASGQNELGNGESGISGTPSWRNAQIGGSAAGVGNVISGNDSWGIDLNARGASIVRGNRIGIDASGEALPNALGGLRITNGISFGDTAEVADNVISQNNGHGVLLMGTLSSVHENEITFNTDDGVAVAGSGAARNTISRNRISSNDGLGIDLDNDGVTPNDTGDGDGGANFRQNFPVDLRVSADRTTVTGTLNSRPNITYRIELFGNSAGVACDSSGNGEGETFLAATERMTDGGGNAPFSVTLQSPLPIGDFVTATATDLTSPTPGNTSEFSQCAEPPPGATLIVRKVTVPSPDATDTSFGFTAGGGLSPNTFTLKNGESRRFDNLVPRAGYSVGENIPAGWDLRSVCSDGSPVSNINLASGETVTCTFTNTKRGHIIIDKVTNPAGDPQSFSFDASGGSYVDFSLTDQDAPNNQVLAAGNYAVSETVPVGWDLVSATCTSSISDAETPGTIELDAGETVTCTFTDRKRGKARVIKIVNGPPPSGTQSFVFQLRSGASATQAGTTLESGTANAANGGIINFTPLLVPGTTYALCEIVMPGWMTTLGPPFYVVYNPSGDNSTVCTDFSVDPGVTKEFAIDNKPPPGGLARTIGFWKNWASCAQSSGKQKPVLDQTLALAEPAGVQIGDLVLHADDCLKAVRILDKSTINSGTKKSSDPAFSLAAQLLAARLNVVAGAGTCPAAVTAINAAQALLDGINFDGITHATMTTAQKNDANSLATTLDRYNNNVLC